MVRNSALVNAFVADFEESHLSSNFEQLEVRAPPSIALNARHARGWDADGRPPFSRCFAAASAREQLTNDPFLEKNLEFMIECTDEFSTEQYSFQQYQRQLVKQQQQQQLYLAKRVRRRARAACRVRPWRVC